jgi:hypothetical protein
MAISTELQGMTLTAEEAKNELVPPIRALLDIPSMADSLNCKNVPITYQSF